VKVRETCSKVHVMDSCTQKIQIYYVMLEVLIAVDMMVAVF
jgi:hypothetical protein